METSRDKITDGGTTSIRLRYSRQFQNSGHTHTIDAETALAVGASPETREQVVRELELSVEQLARQIVQRGARPTGEAYAQPPARSGTATSRSTEPPAPQPATPRPASQEAQPTAPLPVSESMPATPTASGGRTINLPYFIDYIKKRWNMSSQEAMELLGVRELTGLNLRDALYTLRAIKEPQSASSTGSAQTRTTQQPVVEAPRQQNRNAPAAPNSRPPASQSAPDTAPATRLPGPPPTAFKSTTSSAPRAIQTAPVLATAPEAAPERESRPDFAGSSKAPLPIKLGVVRDLAPRPSSAYSFEEEDGEEEEYELPEENAEENARRQAAEGKLETLRNTRGDSAASPERLTVLNNVIGDQISEEQLKQLIKAVWGFTNKKRLKVDQVEALIYWAKEDYFAEEVEKLLDLLDEGEE